jgi:hypothetical protein
VEATVISPAELVADVLNRLSDPGLAPAGAIVGPATDAQQQAGVVSITQAGLPVVELYAPIVHMRAQVRCLAGTLDLADKLAQRVQLALHGKNRLVGRMASTDTRYLIHSMIVNAGPSAHYDSPETWESLMFVHMIIGTEPL